MRNHIIEHIGHKHFPFCVVKGRGLVPLEHHVVSHIGHGVAYKHDDEIPENGRDLHHRKSKGHTYTVKKHFKPINFKM